MEFYGISSILLYSDCRHVVSEWLWLNNYSTALRTAEALLKRLSFPPAFKASNKVGFTEEEILPLVS